MLCITNKYLPYILATDYLWRTLLNICLISASKQQSPEFLIHLPTFLVRILKKIKIETWICLLSRDVVVKLTRSIKKNNQYLIYLIWKYEINILQIVVKVDLSLNIRVSQKCIMNCIVWFSNKFVFNCDLKQLHLKYKIAKCKITVFSVSCMSISSIRHVSRINFS